MFKPKPEGPCQGPSSFRCEHMKSLISLKPFITHKAPTLTPIATIVGSKNNSNMFFTSNIRRVSNEKIDPVFYRV